MSRDVRSSRACGSRSTTGPSPRGGRERRRTSREHNSRESQGVITNNRPQEHVAEGSGVQATVEAGDVQAIVLRPRPKPYRGEYVVLRIGDATQGREMLRRILPHLAAADEWWVPYLPGCVGVPH